MRPVVPAVVLLLVLAGCLSVGGPWSTDTDPGPVDAPPSATPPEDATQAEVVDVVDGDTVRLLLPNGSRETARLLGVDTPEIYGENAPGEFEGVPDTEEGRTCLDRWAERASRYTKDRLLGETVTVAFDQNEPRRGYYGRLLVYVYDDEGEFNYALVREGLARVYDSSFQFGERYYAAEAAAMDANAGLWACREGGAGSTPEPSPTATVADPDAPLRIAEIHADAEGSDRENMNDEYVEFRNAGEAPIDLSGWTVTDEANRSYTFPDGTTLQPGSTLTLHSGSGEDDDAAVYWGASGPVWNNDGDTVTVRNAAGEVVAERSYEG